ncbi:MULTISPECIES: DEAD/DEAH box helicase family protein [unclassified Methanobrevibacter]|uniref:DEAD/DEAH box helicase family protein n=1 Tax=unclassified Methanobrevibacter TaxID=2638681 RepID=UPI0039B932F8
MVKNMKGTGRNPLLMAKELTEMVNNAWEDGSFYENVTPVTQDLLRFWFSDVFCDIRNINFHEGQKQAILNIIYLHEILQVNNVKDLYLKTNPEILQNMDINDLEKPKYQHPMYGVKMATGTGKTWVLNAILIWQYLNAREYDEGNFSKNFLLVAPGLIVYNRLLDAFLGKEDENGERHFESSDFMDNQELFIPENYKDSIFGFLQSSVVKKEEISSKVTGDGLIAITNWHLLSGIEEDESFDSPLDAPEKVLQNVLPISPGRTAGNSLEALDNQFLRGNVVEYLSKLNDLVVFNDEAHHIHEIKKGGEIFEVEWQKSLNKIAESKGDSFIQIDFSATPYTATSGKNKVKHYFPHIITDFELKTAIQNGLVKMIAIDKRREVSSIKLDFKAEREGRKVVGLSEGQKIMLRAGLAKLNILDEEFKNLEQYKRPKMLIVCEDTKVTPLVMDFFKNEGLNEEELLEIHSNKKGNVSEKEWDSIKQRLFNIDKYENPRIIISVLMLREGFDVNNICVIVPLRSTESSILLEQTIGRGLRLMWREPEFEDVKKENRQKILVEKTEPSNYLDLLSIIEHPKFMDFYDKYIEGGIIAEDSDGPSSNRILGDMITVSLKDNYDSYDLYWPKIIRDSEEILSKNELSLNNLKPFNVSLEDLQIIKGEGGEEFESQELTVKTKFGRYNINSDLFSAESYNEFLSKIISTITSMLQPVGRSQKEFPLMQVNNAELAGLIDEYIRTKLFNQEFNPMVDENWRILFMSEDSIISHIVIQVSNVIYRMQNNVDVKDAVVKKKYFSDVSELRMRENYSIEVAKSIYERLPYPSNKGGFEKAFIESCDIDSRVDSFLKINEYYHNFATITYIREDGLLARYYPDFLVKIGNDVYVVETKSDKDINSPNVQSKRIATLDELDKINQLKGMDRMDAKWNYVLLGENTFYRMNDNGASIKEILDYTIVSEAKARGYATLDNF